MGQWTWIPEHVVFEEPVEGGVGESDGRGGDGGGKGSVSAVSSVDVVMVQTRSRSPMSH